MKHKHLEALCDMATEAHTRFQQEIANIDPIVGVSQNMRKNGVPADVMTIDCLKSGKRIILILHDGKPDVVSYLFSWRDKDPDLNFTDVAFSDVTSDVVFDWMSRYLTAD